MEKNPDGTDSNRISRVLCKITVIRGIRDFGAKDQRMKMDQLIIMTGNEKIIKLMKDWRQNDMVSVRGTLITQNFMKSCTCKECGHTQAFKGYAAYINPIYVRIMGQGFDPERGLRDMQQNAEVSNRITVIGKACDDPQCHAHEVSGNLITSYVIDIERKYKVREDDETNRHDFPVVKSYGKIAENDSIAIKKGGYVFIDGQLQARNYIRKFICENCGEEIEKLDNVTEIVPYSTEYLMGCIPMEQVIEIKAQREREEEFNAVSDIFDRPTEEEE